MLYTDNASYFKKADSELRQMHRKIDFDAIRRAGKVDAHLSPISWDFSTEKAPWTNAITERLVQSVKKSLRPTVLRSALTFEQLEVLLIEIEGIINCRPLAVQVSNNPEDLTPITPSLLMYGKNLMPMEDPPRVLRREEVEEPAFVKRFQLRQQLLDTFWRKWQKEYLSRYEINRTWRKKGQNVLNIGDVVVVCDKSDKFGKRNDWKLARVLEPTVFATNGELSGAKCRLANGQVVTRHLRQLALLEADTAFRGKLLKIGPRSHDQCSETGGHTDLTSEVTVPGSMPSRPIPPKSPSRDATSRDSSSIISPVSKNVPSKVQFSADGASDSRDISGCSININRTDLSPEEPKPGSSTDDISKIRPRPTKINDPCPAAINSTDVDECRGDLHAARPPSDDVRRAVAGGCSDQAAADGGGTIGSGEIDSGRTAGNVAREMQSMQARSTPIKRKSHKGHRAHKKRC